MLFNIWGEYLGRSVTRLLKRRVLVEMFSCVLIGAHGGREPRFTLTLRVGALSARPARLRGLRRVFGKKSPVPPRGKPRAQPKGSPPSLARGTTLGPRMVAGSREPGAGRTSILLACFVVLGGVTITAWILPRAQQNIWETYL